MPLRVPPPWRRQRSRQRLLLVLAVLMIVLAPIAIGLYVNHRSPDGWGIDDWAGVANSISLGFLFLFLAVVLESESQKRSNAVADAAMITSMGILAMASARIMDGFDHQALRVPSEAHAALRQYTYASPEQRQAVIKSVTAAYNNLAFSVFCRADGLPRSQWDQLCQGTQAVMKEAQSIERGLTAQGNSDSADLTRMRDHLRFVQSIGTQMRSKHELFPPEGNRRLQLSWFEDALRTTISASEAAQKRIERVARLYGDELTVIHAWERLLDSPNAIACEVILESLDDAREWFSPWYVGKQPRGDGTLVPVNVNDQRLKELAATDVIPAGANVPRFPVPLRHREVPDGMRTAAIANLQNVMVRQAPITVCALVYDLESQDSSAAKRIVLDGNHRLAAALRLREHQVGDLEPPEMRVLAFVLGEKEPVDVEDAAVRGSETWTWKGFSPDVHRLRHPADERPFNEAHLQ